MSSSVFSEETGFKKKKNKKKNTIYIVNTEMSLYSFINACDLSIFKGHLRGHTGRRVAYLLCIVLFFVKLYKS